MSDARRFFTIEATVTYAVWPGSAFVVAKLSPASGTPPKLRFQDQWCLGNAETGAVSVLVPYRLGMFRQGR